MLRGRQTQMQRGKDGKETSSSTVEEAVCTVSSGGEEEAEVHAIHLPCTAPFPTCKTRRHVTA
jgi:hypothetical protein